MGGEVRDWWRERSSVFLMLFLLWTCIRSQTWSQSGLPAVEICQLSDSKLDHAAPAWTAYWKRSVSLSICGICVLSLPLFAGRLGRLIPFSLLNSPVVSQRMLTLPPAPPTNQPTLGRGCSWDEVTVFRYDRDLSSQHTSSSPMWTDPGSAGAWASSSNQMFRQKQVATVSYLSRLQVHNLVFLVCAWIWYYILTN